MPPPRIAVEGRTPPDPAADALEALAGLTELVTILEERNTLTPADRTRIADARTNARSSRP